jgi:hypothetical protein
VKKVENEPKKEMDLDQKVKDAEKNRDELDYIRETFEIINQTLKDKDI